MTLAVLPLHNDSRPSSRYVRPKQSAIPLYGVARRPCLIYRHALSARRDTRHRLVTYHLILVLDEELDSLDRRSRSLCDSLWEGRSATNYEIQALLRTAETPPIMKSTTQICQVSKPHSSQKHRATLRQHCARRDTDWRSPWES